jgi:hypothetical protein
MHGCGFFNAAAKKTGNGPEAMDAGKRIKDLSYNDSIHTP